MSFLENYIIHLLFLTGDGKSGKDPVWKCVSTLSGYHTRTIYDVDWYGYKIIDDVYFKVSFFFRKYTFLTMKRFTRKWYSTIQNLQESSILNF